MRINDILKDYANLPFEKHGITYYVFNKNRTKLIVIMKRKGEFFIQEEFCGEQMYMRKTENEIRNILNQMNEI